MKYDHFSMLPERAFQPRNGRMGMTLESGGPSGTSTTVTSNIPEWLQPQTEALLGAATQEYFTTRLDPATGKREITGLKPYTPYSARPEDYIAGFSPQQQAVFRGAAAMTTPGGFDTGSQLVGAAGQGALGSTQAAYDLGAQGAQYGAQAAQMGAQAAAEAEARARAGERAAYGFGQQGQRSGLLGQELGISGGEYYGGVGAGYGAEAAGLAPEAQMYGQRAAGLAPQAQLYGRTAADIGAMGLRAESLGRDVGEEARQYARQAAGMGGIYERMATDPSAIQAYMSPYQQAVTELAKREAIENAERAQLGANLGAVRQGTYGGARQALAQGQREAGLQKTLSDLDVRGRQEAFERAQQAQQFGVTTGLQGLQGAQAGLGTALQGGQLGLSGIGQAMQGQQAGLAGLGQAGDLYGRALSGLGQAGQLYGLGMQGAGMGLQGVQQQLAGTAQGMQGAQVGLSGVDRALAAGQLGLAGAQTGIQGMQAGMQGAQVGLQGVGAAQAGYGMAGQQGQTLANIAQQQQAAEMARLGFQGDIGAQQQAREQGIIDQAIQNYALAQESPFARLSGYSGLLRGYATPGMTTESYRATNPAQVLAGLGTTAFGAQMQGRKKGGVIEEGIDTLAIRKAKKVAA